MLLKCQCGAEYFHRFTIFAVFDVWVVINVCLSLLDQQLIPYCYSSCCCCCCCWAPSFQIRLGVIWQEMCIDWESYFWYDIILSRWGPCHLDVHLLLTAAAASAGCPLARRAHVASLARCVHYSWNQQRKLKEIRLSESEHSYLLYIICYKRLRLCCKVSNMANISCG